MAPLHEWQPHIPSSPYSASMCKVILVRLLDTLNLTLATASCDIFTTTGSMESLITSGEHTSTSTWGDRGEGEGGEREREGQSHIDSKECGQSVEVVLILSHAQNFGQDSHTSPF